MKNMMKRVQIPKKQTAKEYLAVRVQIVHVKKGWLGFKDKELSSLSAIANTPEEAVEFFSRIWKMADEYGVSIPVE